MSYKTNRFLLWFELIFAMIMKEKGLQIYTQPRKAVSTSTLNHKVANKILTFFGKF
jgi:hypothetical protein